MDWSNMDKKTTLKNILSILNTRFQTFQDEIEFHEEHLYNIEVSDWGGKNDETGVDWNLEYEKSEDKIKELEIEQGKTQDKIDSVMNELGITY